MRRRTRPSSSLASLPNSLKPSTSAASAPATRISTSSPLCISASTSSWTTRPRLTNATRSQVASTSPSRWEFRNTVVPFERSSSMSSRTSTRPSGSRPDAGRRLYEADQELHRSRLARAVRSQKAEHLAAPHTERQVGHGNVARKLFTQTYRVDRGLGHLLQRLRHLEHLRSSQRCRKHVH